MTNNSPLILFLVIASLFSCSNQKINNPKQKLFDAFQTEKIDPSWNFETVENDSMITSIFKNKAVGDRIFLSTLDTSIVLDYFSQENKLTHSSLMFKSKLIRQDSLLYIEVADAANKLIRRISYPTMKNRIPDGSAPPVSGGFGSLEDCIDDFYCTHMGELLCQANRTCFPVRSEITCCFKDGRCVFILIAVSPTKRSCSLPSIYPDILTR